MCRELFGPNAAKELQFILGKSERTCRAWAAGDSEPPSSVLGLLIQSKHGRRVQVILMRDVGADWWTNSERALRVAAQLDTLDLR